MEQSRENADGGILQENNTGKTAVSALGLHDRVNFFELVDDKLDAEYHGAYCLAAIDIEHFKVFNKWYGRERGEEFLNAIALQLRKLEQRSDSIAGYFGGDNFAILLPDQPELLEMLQSELKQTTMEFGNTIGFLPAIGIYRIGEEKAPAMTMYDYALTALSHVVGNYERRSLVYSPSMTDRVEEELRIMLEVKDALEQHQITFYVQPKCRISNGKVVGGEALVRWIHPAKGMISPAVFIPVLEKNGFISVLDRYIWEEVCKKLRVWMDKGLHPVPVSINVSRMDILSMDVVDYLDRLVEKYQIEHRMLKVEITESAYAENAEQILSTLQKLREAGFSILMDDFGSGYSSLNMLKSVIVDVIKIDMRFLDMEEDETEKGIGILESVINMSSTMGIPVIVEGVETKKQEDYLFGMGCRYAQGYYYYKPMPADDFEKLLDDERKLDFDGIYSKQVEQLHLRELMDVSMFNDTLINNILGPIAFYDMYENDIKITRVNEHYYQMLGASSAEASGYTKNFWSHLYNSDRAKVLSVFKQARDNGMMGASDHGRIFRADGSTIRIHIRIFLLREQEGHKLYFGIISEYYDMHEKENPSDIKEGTKRPDEVSELHIRQLEEQCDDLPCSFGVAKIILGQGNKPCDYEILYADKELQRASGCDIGRMKAYSYEIFAPDIDNLMKKCYEAAYEGTRTTHFVYSKPTCRYLQMTLYQYRSGYVGAVLKDMTKIYIYEVVLRGRLMPYREVYFIHLNDDRYRMIYPDENSIMERGIYTEEISRYFKNEMLNPDEKENIREFLSVDGIKKALRYRDSVEYCYRTGTDGDTMEWCLTRFTVGERVNGVVETVVMTMETVKDISKWKREKDSKFWWRYE